MGWGGCLKVRWGRWKMTGVLKGEMGEMEGEGGGA